MDAIIEAKSQEIRRLHKVCEVKNELLTGLYKALDLMLALTGEQISEERRADYHNLVAITKEHLS